MAATPAQIALPLQFKKEGVLPQCEALRARAAAGEALTAPEREKLSKEPGWYGPYPLFLHKNL